MADAVTNSPPLTVLDMESLRTSSAAAEPVPTRRRIRAGVVESATAKCSTLVHNSHLSAGEEQWLHRIRQDRAQGFMVSGPDVDFLLVTLRRFGA